MSNGDFSYQNDWYGTNEREDESVAMSGAVELHESSHSDVQAQPQSSRKYVLLMLAATVLLVALGGYAHSSYAERQHQAALASSGPALRETEQPEASTWPVQTLTPEIAPPPSATPPPPPSPSKDPEPAPAKDIPRPIEERPTQTTVVPSSLAPGCKPCPGGSGVYPAYPTRSFGSRWDFGSDVWVNGPAWYPPVKVRSHEVGWLWVWDCNDFFLRPPH